MFFKPLFLLETDFDLNEFWSIENLSITNFHIIESKVFTSYSNLTQFNINYLNID